MFLPWYFLFNQKIETTWGKLVCSRITLACAVPVHVPGIRHVEIGWSWTCAGTRDLPWGLSVLSSNVAADSRRTKTLRTKTKTRTWGILWQGLTRIDRVTFPWKWKTPQLWPPFGPFIGRNPARLGHRVVPPQLPAGYEEMNFWPCATAKSLQTVLCIFDDIWW